MGRAIESAEDCLRGGGRMGELMRALDWSATGLGPVSSWPQSLRTAVSICLNSRFPILIWWGPEFVKIYNDAYSEIISAKHPRALGQRGRECWPEIWHIIGPMLAGVIERGEATWSENQYLPLERHGYAEECYFTFAYSPIRDESGGVGGIFSVVKETTREILAHRRFAALTQLASGAGAASSEDQCWREVAHALDGLKDVPFAVLYRARGGEGGYELAASANRELAPDAPEHASHEELEALAHGTTRCVLLAVGRASGAPCGYILCGLNAQRPLDADYRSFLELLADHAGNAIGNSRAFEEERRRAEALARLDQAKTLFFSNVSHEFRTPLTLILAPLEDMLANGELTDAQREKAELMRRNALRLQKLVNTLLDFARIEAGRARARFVPTDLGALTTDLASTFRSAVERAGLAFTVETAPGLDAAFVDREMWEKIVLNLLSNALKFTFEGGITVRLAQRGGFFELRVSDTGVGIEAADLPVIFERFRRIEGARSRSHEGSGIGLALVQELAQLHKGRVEVESEPGKGSTFTVLVPEGCAHLPPERVELSSPLARPTAGVQAFVEEALRWSPHAKLLQAIRAGEYAEAAASEAFEVPPARARVVLADDNADMREYVAALLSSRYDVEAFANGADALAACLASPPDMVLSDLMMPLMDGIALVRALRADPRTHGVPVLLLSARADDESRLEAIGAGAQDYLYKPFRAHELLGRIAARLEVARLEAALGRERSALVAMFAQAPIPTAVLRGPDLVFDMANPAYESMIGRGPLAGRTVLEAMPELAGQGFDERLRDVMRSGIPYVGRETPVRTVREGRIVETYFDFIYAPLRDAAGRNEAVIVMASEVTAQVAARLGLHAMRDERAREEATRLPPGALAEAPHATSPVRNT